MAQDRERLLISIILAAGKGTRMRDHTTHKVCHTLQNKPVIRWAIETYESCGIDTQIVVVGAMADQVMQAAASEHEDVLFAFQKEQHGTGHAAKAGARILQKLQYAGDALVIAGDKILDPAILVRLITEFRQRDADLAFLTATTNDFPDAGRVILNDRKEPLGIIEVFDIARVQLLNALLHRCADGPISANEARNLALTYFSREKKAALALGPMWESVQKGFPLTPEILQQTFSANEFVLRLGRHQFKPEDLNEATSANLSVYLFKAPLLYSALDKLNAQNAQQEEYLTDTISILAEAGCRIHTVTVDHPDQVMAFNTPEELARIRWVIDHKQQQRHGEKAELLRRPQEWLADFESNAPATTRYFTSVYGADTASLSMPHRRQFLIALLRRTIQRYGSEPVMIVRTPARVNIMGRHIDHQGGYGNMIAIDREFYAVVSPRHQDQQIFLENLESQIFKPRHFDLRELQANRSCKNWLQVLEHPDLRRYIDNNRGDWCNYVRAVVARLQFEFQDRPLCGLNIMAGGTIPIAAGLSSSSALVVAIAEAVAELNHLHLPAARLVELCGEAEWYVGTRGGAADHAAMKFSTRDRVVQVGFFPFRVTEQIEFPSDHVIAVCNSLQQAHKTANARDRFNQRVACYEIGRDWLRALYPQYQQFQHLRDFSPSHLGMPDSVVYEMLQSLPAAPKRSDIVDRFGEQQTQYYLRNHTQNDSPYPLRGVVLYGLAEIERALHCSRLLQNGQIDEFGRWMNISHDGDRVVRFDKKGQLHPCPTAETEIDLRQQLASCNLGQPQGRLINQSGAYRCSIEQIDQMVDLALSLKGVKGAQLAGAGLGGCMMVLVQRASFADLAELLTRSYYEPHNLEPQIILCSPVAGSAPIAFST